MIITKEITPFILGFPRVWFEVKQLNHISIICVMTILIIKPVNAINLYQTHTCENEWTIVIKWEYPEVMRLMTACT